MGGDKIRQLNTGMATLNHHLHSDEHASLRVEIALVAVGGVPSRPGFAERGTARVLDIRGRGGAAVPATGAAFAPANDFVLPTLEAHGLTPLGEGMRLALKLIRSRKDELRALGLRYYRPWILLVSDGAPNDGGWEQAADEAVAEEKRHGVCVYAVGVKDTDTTRLARFSIHPPLKLRASTMRGCSDGYPTACPRLRSVHRVAGKFRLRPPMIFLKQRRRSEA